MEWRDVPGYPGYQVSARGKLRKASGYEIGLSGRRYVLSCGGVRVRLTPQELVALAWAPKPVTPARELPRPCASEESAPSAPAIPEGFVPVPGVNGYYLDRHGTLIGLKGQPLKTIVHATAAPQYRIGGTSRSVPHLLVLTFGSGAAAAAGYPEPDAEAVVPIRPGDRKFGQGAKRRCHDCGRPTNNYRCDACWARLRGRVEAEENEWNAL